MPDHDCPPLEILTIAAWAVLTASPSVGVAVGVGAGVGDGVAVGVGVGVGGDNVGVGVAGTGVGVGGAGVLVGVGVVHAATSATMNTASAARRGKILPRMVFSNSRSFIDAM